MAIKRLKEAEATPRRVFFFRQNNSGGKVLAPAINVIVAGDNAEVAGQRFLDITDADTSYCDCCGERWSFYSWEDATPFEDILKSAHRAIGANTDDLLVKWNREGRKNKPDVHELIVITDKNEVVAFDGPLTDEELLELHSTIKALYGDAQD